jgi:DNA-nicking Smr family endonuclease
MVRKRSLTPEEKKLWKHITRNDVPLKVDIETEESEEMENAEIIQPEPIEKSSKKQQTVDISKRSNSPSKIKPLGDYSGIDRNTAERFRKGDAPIDATLDLHGMTRENAHRALVAFIGQQMKLESRRLLVITGKGSGILRSSLPDWLTAPNLSEAILAFDVAKQKHGGAGAYYILLKRKRK